MDIGEEEDQTIRIEPIEDPVPGREPAPTREPAPAPVRRPAEPVPEPVPA